MRLSRPWSFEPLAEDTAFRPSDCLLSEEGSPALRRTERTRLMHGAVRGEARRLFLHPYPRRSSASFPDREGFPVRLRSGQEPKTEEEVFAQDTLRRMNEVLARVRELEEALDDPAHLWSHLRAAWHRAENEQDPRMAEIVRQASVMDAVLKDLVLRIRRVLRRSRELTRLDRVQEMDRASMQWLSRQPGHTIAERAGGDQRILATIRRENFDTLENRVLHAYVRLAADVAREWAQEHPGAAESRRFQAVDSFRKQCRAVARHLADLGIGIARPGITPNYVLMQDKSYREVQDAWIKLLLRERAIDELWAWQAETWTDFAVLAIVLALDEMEESELVAQSPVIWRTEAATGRWFNQDRPLAVFWLRNTGRVVEVPSRPEEPGPLQTLARAHVSLKITDPSGDDFPRRVAVWTPHAMERMDLETSVRDAARMLEQIQRVQAQEIMRDGLILLPGHGQPGQFTQLHGKARVEGISLDASGTSLAQGLSALSNFARSDIYRDLP